jgi:hypothetical protein
LFSTINGWTPTCFFWRRCTPFFIAKNTLVFTLIVQRVFSFSSTAFSFRFLPWFFVQILLFLCIKVCLDLWSMLVFIFKSCYKKGWLVLEKRKSFMLIVVQMGACLDSGLDFCMSCLMLFW